MDQVFESYFQGAFKSVAREFEDWVESFDPLGFGKRYKDAALRAYSRFKILGMSKPVDLASVFIDVVVREDIPSRIYMDYEELERYVQQQELHDRQEYSEERKQAIEFFKDNLRVLVLGKPGAGKTTLLRFLLIGLLGPEPPIRSFPVYLSLKEFSDAEDKGIVGFVGRKMDLDFGFPRKNALPFVRRMLKRGDIILLLDGLDEVPEPNRPLTIQAINSIVTKYPNARIIVTCRTADYLGWFDAFSEVAIADFNTRQIKEFAKRWFANDSKRLKSLVGHLESSSSLRELCSIPLMAAMVCILFQYNLKLPQSRPELYAECVDALLYRWDASRLVDRTTSYKMLSTHKKKMLFSTVAFEFMVEQKVVFRREELAERVALFLRSLGVEDSEGVIREIASHHAIFVEKAAGLWSFLHLTFQEYFAALCIAQHRLEEATLEEHFEDPRWREVFLLTGPLLPSADSFVQKLTDILTSNPLFEKYGCFAPNFLMLASGRFGLKEAKDTIEAQWRATKSLYRLRPSVVGEKKINQIKYVRDCSLVLEQSKSFLSWLGTANPWTRATPTIGIWREEDIHRIVSRSDVFGRSFDYFWSDESVEFAALLGRYCETVAQDLILSPQIHSKVAAVFKLTDR